jgi:hypothetical protein
MPMGISTLMPEPTKIDPTDFKPAPRSVVSKIDPKDFTPLDVAKGVGAMALGGLHADEAATATKKAFSSPEMALRTIPPIALQTAGAVGGGMVAGEPGAAVGGAAASVLTDYYERFLNHMYGRPNAPVSLGREATSAVIGAITSEAPAGAKAISGLRGAEKIAAEAATKQTAARQEIVGDIADRAATARTNVSKEQARISAEDAANKAKLSQDATAKTADATKKIQEDIAQNRDKLLHHQIKVVGKAREEVAPQIATEQIQRMAVKTPQQLARQEATADTPAFAEQRAKAMSPVYDAARQYHQEVGAKFEPYIKDHRDEIIEGKELDDLNSNIAGIKQRAAEYGHNIDSDTELKKIFNRIDEATGATPEIDATAAKGGKVKLSNEQVLAIKQAEKGKGSQGPIRALTVGELWGLRSRLGARLAGSTNPGVRLAAHQGMDAITELMPNVPQAIKDQYATQKTLFPQKLMGELSRARNPGEVGQAIFGTPTTPEPAQIALNVIRRAKTPEAQEGLRTAFADNWLSKPRNPDDINRYNPAVIKELYGKDADMVFSLLGHDGSFKSAKWNQLIAANPKAQQALIAANDSALQDEKGKALTDAIAKGEAALKDIPQAHAAYLAAIKGEKAPEGKLPKLMEALQKAQQPTEAEQEKLLKSPQDAAVGALAKRGFAPDSRLERMALAGLAFRAYFSIAGAGGAIAKHPELAVGAGVLLGGRGLIRSALSSPKLGRAYVNMLNLPAIEKNAASMGNVLGQLTAASALQYVKDTAHDGGTSAPANP